MKVASTIRGLNLHFGLENFAKMRWWHLAVEFRSVDFKVVISKSTACIAIFGVSMDSLWPPGWRLMDNVRIPVYPDPEIRFFTAKSLLKSRSLYTLKRYLQFIHSPIRVAFLGDQQFIFLCSETVPVRHLKEDVKHFSWGVESNKVGDETNVLPGENDTTWTFD